MKFPEAALWAAGFIPFCTAPFFVWQRHAAAQSAEGRSFKVYRDGIQQVSALALDARNNLCVSQKFAEGRGRILELFRTADAAR